MTGTAKADVTVVAIVQANELAETGGVERCDVEDIGLQLGVIDIQCVERP